MYELSQKVKFGGAHMKEKFKNWRDRYVIWHANTYSIPSFEKSLLIRKKVWFYGRVQNVGFRLETEHLAKRIGLVGSVQNLDEGCVYAELQGTSEQIQFLIKCMKALRRAAVKHVWIEDEEIDEDATEFIVIK